eukprot:1162129-Pelagomonas_calceolata.AAC.7
MISLPGWGEAVVFLWKRQQLTYEQPGCKSYRLLAMHCSCASAELILTMVPFLGPRLPESCLPTSLGPTYTGRNGQTNKVLLVPWFHFLGLACQSLACPHHLDLLAQAEIDRQSLACPHRSDQLGKAGMDWVSNRHLRCTGLTLSTDISFRVALMDSGSYSCGTAGTVREDRRQVGNDAPVAQACLRDAHQKSGSNNFSASGCVCKAAGITQMHTSGS